MSFARRIESYRKFMNIAEKRDMAAILGIEPGSYSGYTSGKRTPHLNDLVPLARTLGVSIDWLAGMSEQPMWGPDVQNLRPHFWQVARAADPRQLDIRDRCLLIIEEIRKRLPDLANQKWFLPGLLFLSENAFQELMNDPQTDHLGPQVATRLAMFTGLPEMWFMMGTAPEAECRGFEEYIPLIAALIDNRVSPQEGLEMIGTIRRLAETKRALG